MMIFANGAFTLIAVMIVIVLLLLATRRLKLIGIKRQPKQMWSAKKQRHKSKPNSTIALFDAYKSGKINKRQLKRKLKEGKFKR